MLSTMTQDKLSLMSLVIQKELVVVQIGSLGVETFSLITLLENGIMMAFILYPLGHQIISHKILERI